MMKMFSNLEKTDASHIFRLDEGPLHRLTVNGSAMEATVTVAVTVTVTREHCTEEHIHTVAVNT